MNRPGKIRLVIPKRRSPWALRKRMRLFDRASWREGGIRGGESDDYVGYDDGQGVNEETVRNPHQGGKGLDETQSFRSAAKVGDRKDGGGEPTDVGGHRESSSLEGQSVEG